MDQSQLRQLYQDNFYYIILIQMVFGLVLGLIPLLLGMRRGKRNLGLIGFVCCLVAAAVSPILSLLICGLFIFLVLRKGNTAS